MSQEDAGKIREMEDKLIWLHRAEAAAEECQAWRTKYEAAERRVAEMKKQLEHVTSVTNDNQIYFRQRIEKLSSDNKQLKKLLESLIHQIRISNAVDDHGHELKYLYALQEAEDFLGIKQPNNNEQGKITSAPRIDTEIWKWTLQASRTVINAPADTRWLCVHEQGDTICVWGEVYPLRPSLMYDFRVYNTGRPITIPNDKHTYLGTAHLQNGSSVVHVFVMN